MNWKISKEELPSKDGYYFVGNSNQNPFWCRKVTYFKGKFYDNNFYLRDDDKINTDYFNNKESRKFIYWMEIPNFPELPEKDFYEQLRWASDNEKKMLASAGIDSIDKLLNTPKNDLFKIKGFKNRAFRHLLQYMSDYEYPSLWGSNIDLFRIENGRPDHCEILCKIITGIEAKDIPNFRDMSFDNVDAANLVLVADETTSSFILAKLRGNHLYQGEKRSPHRNKILIINYSTNPEARLYFFEYYGRERFNF